MIDCYLIMRSYGSARVRAGKYPPARCEETVDNVEDLVDSISDGGPEIDGDVRGAIAVDLTAGTAEFIKTEKLEEWARSAHADHEDWKRQVRAWSGSAGRI